MPILFLVHALVFAAAYLFSYLLRFEFAIPPDYAATFHSSVVVVLGVQLAVGAVFGFYRGWWRYVGIADVVRLVAGLTTAAAILLVLCYLGPHIGFADRFVKTPRGVLLIDWAFSLLILFGARVTIRLGRDRFRPVRIGMINESKRVIVIGAGDAGETLAREIEHRPQLGMKLVGFVDDQKAKWHSHIRGIRVFGPIKNVGAIAEDLRAEEALIAIPSASGKRIREIIHELSEAGIPFKTIPGIDDLVSGRVHASQLRPVNVEDLLRRERIDLPGHPVEELFKGKRILVTGAGGTIGAELSSQILQLGPERLTLVERSEYALYEVMKRLTREAPDAIGRVIPSLLDISDRSRVEARIAADRPHIVLHAAAHKHVPLGEKNPAEYVRNNTIATRALAELCNAHSVARFVFISTDKAINPSSIMGASKRAAEILLVDLANSGSMTTSIVRFGNVIGSSGSVIPLFMEQIAAGGPLTVTHPDVTRYFIRTSEAVSLVLQAATLGNGGQVFMLHMGDPIRIVDLARDLIHLSNHTEAEIPITFTGLRPGEKLFEEIRLKGEFIHPTVHPQIVVTEAPQPNAFAVREWMRSVEAMQNGSGDDIRRLLLDFVADFGEPESSDATAAEQQSARPFKRSAMGALPQHVGVRFDSKTS